MIPEDKSYRKIIEILRKSEPYLAHPEEVENEVINRIMDKKADKGKVYDITEKLFGWVYIGWVRRSLVTASLLLVLVFSYQQASILRQVRKISEQSVVITNEPLTVTAEDAGKRLTIFRLSNKLITAGEIRISEEQLEQLIESYNDLQSKYSDLIKIIEEDPELKEYIERKLNKNVIIKSDI